MKSSFNFSLVVAPLLRFGLLRFGLLRFGLLALGLSLVSGDALAKGQLTPNAQAKNPGPTTAAGVSAQADISSGFSTCPAPTSAQCLSASYATTTCGRYYSDRAMSGIQVCPRICPVPTLAQCGSDDYFLSLCGVMESRQMMMLGGDARATSPSVGAACPTTNSQCVNLLCQQLATTQSQPQQTIVPGATSQRVVRPSFAASNLGNAVDNTLSHAQNGYAVVNANNIVSRRALQPDYKSWSFEGGSKHWWGDRLANHIATLPNFGNQAVPSALAQQRQLRNDERTRWESNGNQVDECREYVYEKYFDYSRFEDAAFVAGADYRHIFNVAFGAQNLPSSIGTRIIAGLGLRQRDGSQSPGTLTFRTNVPRNEFFHYGMVSPEMRQQRIADFENNDGQYRVRVLNQGTNSDQLIRLTRPVFLDVSFPEEGSILPPRLINGRFHFVPLNNELYQLLRNRPLHNESMQFHRNMSNAMISQQVPDEVLFIYDRIKDDFSRLISRRLDIEEDLRRLVLFVAENFADDFIFENAVFDPSIFENPALLFSSTFDSVLATQRERVERFDIDAGFSTNVRVRGVRTSVKNAIGAAGGQNQQTVSGGTVVGGGALGGSANALRGTKGATAVSAAGGDLVNRVNGFVASSSTSFDAVSGAAFAAQEFKRILEELNTLDAQIEASLLYANDLGCIDPARTPFSVSPCDWSPRDFSEAMQDQLIAEREQNLARCEAFTGGNFDNLTLRANVPGRFDPKVNPPTDVVSQVFSPVGSNQICDNARYNNNPNRLDRYPVCRDAWRVAILRNIEKFVASIQDALKGAKDIFDPVTGDVRPNEEEADSDGFGDKKFGASYDYGAGWSMTVPNADPNDASAACEMRPTVHANFDVTARIFGTSKDLINASVEAGIGPNVTNRAVLEVLGVELINKGTGQGAVNGNAYNVLFEASRSKKDTFFRASARFTIGPVPVTVSAGAAGVIGGTVRAAGGNLSGGQGCTNGDLGIEASFSPSYGIQAFASAGVDALVVEVGLKIEITIIQLSFPFRTTLKLDKTQDGWGLQLTNDLDIVLSIMGGRLSGYVEVCFILCEEIDVTLWKWAPTKFKSNIFHTALDFDMASLLRVQQLMPIPVPGANQ